MILLAINCTPPGVFVLLRLEHDWCKNHKGSLDRLTLYWFSGVCAIADGHIHLGFNFVYVLSCEVFSAAGRIGIYLIELFCFGD